MEKAVVIYSLKNLENLVREYDRIYFGGEFCQQRIPTDREMERILDLAKKQEKKLTLLTPVCNDAGIARIRDIVEKYGKLLADFGFEIVINDWGVMELLNDYPQITKVAGRSLLHYKKDPRIRKLPVIPEELKYNVAQSGYMQAFLRENGCERVELDNVDYLLEDIGQISEMSFSVYVPYVYVTTTRMCRMQDENIYNTTNELKPRVKCDRKCEKYMLELKNQDIGESILVRGNTQFYYSKEQEQEWYEERNVSRIVYDDLTNQEGNKGYDTQGSI